MNKKKKKKWYLIRLKYCRKPIDTLLAPKFVASCRQKDFKQTSLASQTRIWQLTQPSLVTALQCLLGLGHQCRCSLASQWNEVNWATARRGRPVIAWSMVNVIHKRKPQVTDKVGGEETLGDILLAEEQGVAISKQQINKSNANFELKQNEHVSL